MLPKNQKGAAPLLVLLILVVVGLIVFVGLRKGGKPGQKGASEPKVVVAEIFQNPFDKNTQYANPFTAYQNPFNNIGR